MARRQRIDTVSGSVAVMVASAREISPPANVPLKETDLPFFNKIISECARSEWTDHQLDIAALLARTMADLDSEQQLLREEGSVLASVNGMPIVNPRKSLIQMHAGNIISMRRSLSLHARAQGGEARDVGKRRAIAREIEAGNPLDDDLIARPN